MNRFLVLAAALSTSTVLLAATATPAFAAPATGYSLVPAAAVTSTDSVVSSDVVWKRVGDRYVAPVAGSRPAMVCAQVVKKLGKVSSFTANGEEFDEAALAKCNEKAK